VIKGTAKGKYLREEGRRREARGDKGNRKGKISKERGEEEGRER
jgi:hypothetical protein